MPGLCFGPSKAELQQRQQQEQQLKDAQQKIASLQAQLDAAHEKEQTLTDKAETVEREANEAAVHFHLEQEQATKRLAQVRLECGADRVEQEREKLRQDLNDQHQQEVEGLQEEITRQAAENEALIEEKERVERIVGGRNALLQTANHRERELLEEVKRLRDSAEIGEAELAALAAALATAEKALAEGGGVGTKESANDAAPAPRGEGEQTCASCAELEQKLQETQEKLKKMNAANLDWRDRFFKELQESQEPLKAQIAQLKADLQVLEARKGGGQSTVSGSESEESSSDSEDVGGSDSDVDGGVLPTTAGRDKDMVERLRVLNEEVANMAAAKRKMREIILSLAGPGGTAGNGGAPEDNAANAPSDNTGAVERGCC